MTLRIHSEGPYYDDYTDGKGFYRILFKPGTAVQARELTQLQTILQKQIERHGSHIFKDGSMVLGGQTTQDFNCKFVRINKTVGGDPVDIATITDGRMIQGTTDSGDGLAKAKVISYQEDDDYYTLVVKAFSDVPFTQDEDLEYQPDPDVAGTVVAKVIDEPYIFTGKASLLSVTSGVFYTKGLFVYCEQQTIPLAFDIYNNIGEVIFDGSLPSVRAGLDIVESTVDADIDTTLLDPALGSYNYNAPGADRYKIELVLTKYPLLKQAVVSATVNPSTTAITALNIIDGGYGYPTSDFLSTEVTFTGSTLDGTGNGAQGQVTTVDPDTGTITSIALPNGGSGFRASTVRVVVAEPVDTVENFIELARFDGGQLIKALRVPTYADLGDTMARRTYDESGNYSLNPFVVRMSNRTGFPDQFLINVDAGKAYVKGYEINHIATTNIVNDRCRDTNHQRSVEGYNINSYYGNYVLVERADITGVWDHTAQPAIEFREASSTIGTGTLVYISLESSGVYRFHLSDVTFTSNKSIADADSFRQTANPTRIALLDVANRQLVEAGTASLLFKLPQINIKTVDDSLDFSYRVLKTATVSSNSITITQTGGVQFKEVSGATADKEAAYILFDTTANAVLSMATIAVSTSFNGSTATAVFTGAALTNTNNITVLATVSGDNIGRKDKTAVTGQTYVTGTMTTADTEIVLDKWDVTHLTSVVGGSVDYTRRFTLDSGQRDASYEYAVLRLKPGETMPKGVLTVTFDYFSHGSGGSYFSVDSYPDYDQIPTYINKAGASMRLSDVLDFRYTPGANDPVMPDITDDIVVDFTYYLGRIDRLVLSATGEFMVVKGVPSLNPVKPPIDKNSMTIGLLSLKPYTLNVPQDVSLVLVDNKRYTMRDIGVLDSRIGRLEYYNTLSLLEKASKDLLILDANGNDRFKNGVLVESFDGHSISDVLNPDFYASVSLSESYMTAPTTTHPSTLQALPATRSTVALSDNIVTLDYSSVPFITQNKASKTENVNPFAGGNFRGKMILNPSVATWHDEESAPEIIINDGENDNHDCGNHDDDTSIQDDRHTRHSHRCWRYRWYHRHWLSGHDRHHMHMHPCQTHVDVSIPELGQLLPHYHAHYTQYNEQDDDTQPNYVWTRLPSTWTHFCIHTRAHRHWHRAKCHTRRQYPQECPRDPVDAHAIDHHRHIHRWHGYRPIRFVRNILTGQTQMIPGAQPPVLMGMPTNQINDGSQDHAVEQLDDRNIYIPRGVSLRKITRGDEDKGGIVNTSIVPHVATNDVLFACSSLKPNTRVWPYFDGTSVSAYVRRAEVVKVDTITGGLACPRIKAFVNAGGPARVKQTTAGGVVEGTVIISRSGLLHIVQDDASKHFEVSADPAKYMEFRYTITTTDGTEDAYNTQFEVTGVQQSSLASADTFKTDVNGNLSGVFVIPAGMFKTGDRMFQVMDVATNVIANSSTSAEATYSSQGMLTSYPPELGPLPTTRPETELPPRTGSISAGAQLIASQLGVPLAWFDPLAQSFLVDAAIYPNGIFLESVDLFFSSADEEIPVNIEIRKCVNGYPSGSRLPTSLVEKDADEVNTTGGVVTPSLSNPDTLTNFKFNSPVYLAPGEYALVVQSNSNFYNTYVAEVGALQLGGESTNQHITEQPYAGSLFKSQNASTWTASQEEDLMFRLNRCEFVSEGSIEVAPGDFESEFPFLYDEVTLGKNVIDFAGLTTIGYEMKTTSKPDSVATALELDAGWTTFAPDDPLYFSTRQILSADDRLVAAVTSQTVYDLPWLNETADTVRVYLRADDDAEEEMLLDRTYYNIRTKSGGGPGEMEFVWAALADPPVTGEIFRFTRNSTAKLKLTLETTTPEISPLIDLGTSSLTFVRNEINNGEITPTTFGLPVDDDIPTPMVTVGGGGTGAQLLLHMCGGEVIGVEIENGGSGYTSPTATVTTTQTTPPSVTATITLGETGGVITSAVITDGGAGYLAPDVTITSTEGSGASVYALVRQETYNSEVSGQVYGWLVVNPGSGYVDDFSAVMNRYTTPTGTTTTVALTATNEAGAKSGNCQVRYISRRVTLADGFEAEDLKVYLTAMKPQGSGVEVYYKVLAADDGTLWSDRGYVRMEPKADVISSSLTDYREMEFSTTGGTCAYDGYTSFKIFAIKIVLTASVSSQVPRIQDLRAIALDTAYNPI